MQHVYFIFFDMHGYVDRHTYCVSLSLNYPVSSRSRTLLLVLSWKLQSPVISLTSYALFTGARSLNASNTSSSHLPTKFSQLHDLRTFITSSPFNVLAVCALHPSLLSLERPPSSSSLKITDRSFRYASPVSGISSLCLFVNLLLAPVLPFPTNLFLHPSLLPLLIHHSVHL